MTTIYIPVEVEKELPKKSGYYFVICFNVHHGQSHRGCWFEEKENRFQAAMGVTHWLKPVKLPDLSDSNIEKMAEEKFPITATSNNEDDHDKFVQNSCKQIGYTAALKEIRQLLNPESK